MHRFILCLSMLALGVQSISAQIATKGSSFVSLGYGFPSATQLLGVKSPYVSGVSASSDFKFNGFGPLHLRYEYMLGNRVGLGLSVNAEFGKFNLNRTYLLISNNTLVTETNQFRFNSLNALGRFNFHFLKNSKYLDLYWGTGIGFGKTNISWIEDTDTYKTDPEKEGINEFVRYVTEAFPGMNLESVLGLRWAISPNAGLYIEAGKSKSIIQIGVFGKMGKYDAYDRNYWRRLN